MPSSSGRSRAAARSPSAPPARAASVFYLDVPFACRREVHDLGARWDVRRKAWVYQGVAIPPALRRFRPQPYSLERWREDRERGIERPLSVPERNIVLREHQADAVRAITLAARQKRVGFLLADEVGLGKTIAAWKSVAMLPGAKTVLIVCPLAVAAHWRRTVMWMGDHGKEVIILNYDRLAKLFELPSPARGRADAAKPASGAAKPRTLKGVARLGKAPAFDVVVFDESHLLANPDSARSRLAAKLTAKAGFVLWLSATAGTTPLSLSYLAPLLAQRTGDKVADLKHFARWCQEKHLGVRRAPFGKWVFEGGEQECAAVHELLFGGRVPVGLRRRPEDVAGWPEMERIPLPLELAPDAYGLYEEAWTEFRKVLELERRGGDPKNGLAARLRFRQKASLLRAPGTVELVRELLDNGRRVAVSVAFLESLELIRAALANQGIACAAIHGGLPAEEREAERLRFQREEAPVCLFTVVEGISLHEGEHGPTPRALVIHDLRWSAIQMAQVEGRTHRDGKFAPAYWCFAADTVEERIAAAVAAKMTNMKAMVGDDVETLKEIEQVLIEALERSGA